MHFFGIGIHILVAVFFAIHAVRTNQPLYWLLILFLFPLLGSIVYGVAIWLPEIRQHRGVRRAGSAVRRILDPARELREANEAIARSPSVGNQLRLADALLDAGRPAEAVPHYRLALQGLYARDPDIQARLARALVDSSQPKEARELLDRLIADNPDFRSPSAHLTYARAVADCDDRARAHEEFGVLVEYYPGLEARARYATLLHEWGETARAQQLAADTLRDARQLPAHTRENERQWLALLQKADRAG
ncbi:MAG TPA: tetratricopeptide repeat protein [Arenimonas sp.]|uniref:tetratricopeptide repeat protein n=1 Tax=Arenimonas sp. TaxID=1872635 RepID=UPI002D80CE17|nr:tetratricopeptide repeat protein [Arenimonas sp.]HEU0154339.1 tetratricopeptide repeat protein [Arenimonas sp.]